MYSDHTKITASTSRFFEGKVPSKHLVAKGKLETSITKRSGDNLSTLKGNVNKPRQSIRKSNNYANSVMGRNTLKEENSDTDRLQNNQSSDDSRHIQYPGGNRILLSSKKKSGILLAHPRTSFTNQRAMSKKLMDTSASSRKNVGTVRRGVHASSKVKLISNSTCTLGAPKSAAENASSKKEVEVACQPILDSVACIIPGKSDLEKVPSDDDGSSKETVTAIISRPKRMRRRSYTSSLVERSKDKLPAIDDDTNPLEAVEYIEDIYEYYWIMEVQNPSLANYMDIQTDVTPRLRGILINWLIEVHHKFQLMEETLFLMVELNDRFLSMVSIDKDQLQLVGLTALLLASKYEDFWHPKIKDLISISANAYTRDQMLAMEKLILRKLKFRLSSPTPYVFMLRFLKAAQSDNKKLEHLAFYLIELCLVEYEALKFKPSLLCATAIYIARCTIHISPPWTAVLSKHARYEESQLRACGEMILSFHRAAAKGPLKVTYEKYLNPDRCCVSAIRPLSSLPT
ncbi:putative cyclin-B3-1 [Acorus gramineus]|uniref:Cyclin-B3-1 n=1 Tax=Acorus gramineus TaxID=55184 RepID=A0AAV9BSF4_ACOGR|nr:putative cyclin-B3-1 [Acorus gramineus]